LDLMTGSVGIPTTTPIPVFGDSAYGNDELPILYYRMDVKYDPSTGAPGTGNNIVYAKYGGTTASSASFYLAANEYLATKTGTSAAWANSQVSRLVTTAASHIGGSAPTYPAPGSTYLDDLVAQQVGGNYVPRGAYVLISAGPDRIYGRDPKGNVDDIIVAGGN